MFGRKHLRELERENAAMRDALQFYAAPANWRRKGVSAQGTRRQWVMSPATSDRGEIAQRVLFLHPERLPRSALDSLLRPLFGRKANQPEASDGDPGDTPCRFLGEPPALDPLSIRMES
jgi:hypothetical protein